MAVYVCPPLDELNTRYLQLRMQSLLQQLGLSRPRHLMRGYRLCGKEVEACGGLHCNAKASCWTAGGNAASKAFPQQPHVSLQRGQTASGSSTGPTPASYDLNKYSQHCPTPTRAP